MTFDLSSLGAWHDLPFFCKDLPQIEMRLANETSVIFPASDATFRALELCQPDECKVVILGQDPYHTQGKADGLAFSIQPGFTGRLDSLGNIFKELEGDLNVRHISTDLSDWARQGVLLLNTALTVPEGKAGAHKAIGWSTLIAEVLQHLSDQPRAYILWGAHAQKAAKAVDRTSNLKLETAHPSPLSAHRGFFGSRPFSSVNRWLKEQGQTEVQWGDQA